MGIPILSGGRRKEEAFFRRGLTRPFYPPRLPKVNLDELGAHGSTLILLRSIDGLQGHVPGLNLRNMTVFCLCLSLFSRASHRQGFIRRCRRRRKALVMTWLSLLSLRRIYNSLKGKNGKTQATIWANQRALID